MKTYKETEELERSDTEITLGLRSILGIFFGLVLICGVFFGFGYSIGHGNARRAPETAAQTSSPSPQAIQPPAIKTVVEPSSPVGTSGSDNAYVADQNGPGRKPAEASLPSRPSAAPPVAASAAQSVASAAAANSSGSPAKANALPVAYPLQASGTEPIMVQIAAVSRRDDADALVAALKNHGYSASVQTGPSDHLLHVQIGPFASRDEARAMRTRLLNDGYNAILK